MPKPTTNASTLNQHFPTTQLDRIRQPGFEEDVRAKLAGYVTEPELKGRFRAVKHGRHRLQQPDIKTVPDWQNEEEDESDYGYFYTTSK